MSKEKKIYVVGIGPGSYEGMTGAAATALEKSDVIVGYTVYIDLVKDHFPGKIFSHHTYEKGSRPLCNGF